MPNDPPRAPLPAPLDRPALERVLARAAELQGEAGEGVDGALTEAQLLDVGREVGIDASYLRQALAEERTRVGAPIESGLVGRLTGPAAATATRVLAGAPTAVLAALDDLMQREECLQVKRRQAGRMTWEARRDFMGSLKRGLRMGGHGYDLTRAGEVGATVTAVDDQRSLVRLDADLAPALATALRGGAAAAATGTVAGTALGVGGVVANAALIALVPLAIIPVAMGLGGGLAIMRAHRGTAARAQLALERVLDQLEHGAARRPPSMLDVVSSVARRIR